MAETIAVVAAKVGIIFGLALAIGWMFSMVFRWIASFGLEPGLVKQLQIAQRRLIIGCLALATGLSLGHYWQRSFLQSRGRYCR